MYTLRFMRGKKIEEEEGDRFMQDAADLDSEI